MDTITITPDIRHRIETTFRDQQAFAPTVARTRYRERIKKLERLESFMKDSKNVEALTRAMQKDFNKPEVEVLATEIGVVQTQIDHVRKHLKRWMRQQKVSTPLPLVGTSSYIYYEPKGVSLILAPWNYPFNLAIVPLVYAIAAGNTVILKPSEISAHTSAFLHRMMAQLYEEREVAVFEGDASVAQALLDLPFNHIYFTGSPQIGKLVMKAAAEHLASVTLELGGKSPAIVDATADLKATAAKTVWGKCVNNGQTCIAPDYMILHESIADDFVRHYRESLQVFYDPERRGIQKSSDYSRIINRNHFRRLKELYEDAIAKGAEVLAGGEFDEEDKYIAPTLLTDVDDSMDIMQEEIFGPLLPLITYRQREEVVDIIRRRPKPLTLYINSRDRSNIRFFLEETSAGGTVINDYLLGYSNPNLPFGGVNNSGIGKTMGFHGFVEFSNERAVIKRNWGSLKMIYPPYTDRVKQIIQLIYQWM